MIMTRTLPEFIGRGFVYTAYGAVAVFVAAAIFLSAVPIPQSVIASGAVSSLRATRAVQHDAGGVILKVPVVDGQFVERGDILVEFDSTGLQAERTALATELVVLKAERESLLEASGGDRDGAYSRALNALASSHDLEDNLALQSSRASAKSQVENELTAQLAARERSSRLRRDSLVAERRAKSDELALLQDLIARKAPLVDDGFASLADVNLLRIEEAALRGEIERLNAELVGVNGEIATIQSDAARIPKELALERLTRLAELSREIADKEMRMTRVRQALVKASVRAPLAGQVIGLSANTVGSFVAPAHNIAMIVPSHEELIIDVRLRPRDIDAVNAGMKAKVVFSAFPQRAMPEIVTTVESVTRDVLEDPATGATYYQARLKIPEQIFDSVPGARAEAIFAGMPVEVYITVDRAPILHYLAAPLRQSFRRSFRA